MVAAAHASRPLAARWGGRRARQARRAPAGAGGAGRVAAAGVPAVGPLVLAADVGTTGLKAALVSPSGELCRRARAAYARKTACAGASVEQAPDDWVTAFARAASECCGTLSEGRVVDAVVISGQMQNTIVRGRDTCLLYSDSRAAEQAAWLERSEAVDVSRLSNYKSAASCLAKWLWLQQNEPAALEVLRRDGGRLLFGAHAHVARELCGGDEDGVSACDRTTAATTGLLQAGTDEWATDAVAAAGLDAALLPALRPAEAVLGEVTRATAEALGLPDALVGARVVQGCGDLGATTLGVGFSRHYMYLGTSGWVARTAAMDEPAQAQAAGVFDVLHPQVSQRIVAASMTTAGGAAMWAALQMLSTDLKGLDRLAEHARPGAGGVLFMPHLTGERSPFLDAGARGAYLGIGADCGREELARATLEGVALGYRSLMECMGVEADASRTIPLVGGGARSKVWPQIVADVTGQAVEALGDEDAVAARGVAAIAYGALGHLDTYDSSAMELFMRGGPGAAQEPRVYVPNESTKATYDEASAVYGKLYPVLKSVGLYNRSNIDDRPSI